MGQERGFDPPPGNVRTDLILAAIASLPLALRYFAGVPNTVGTGDSAEFTVAFYTLGLAHPPGYPIYTLLGRLCSLVPVGTVAMRANLLSAALASATLFLIFRIVARESYSIAKDRVLAYSGAAIAVAVAGASVSFWKYATVAEAYAPNVFAVVVFVYLMLSWVRTGRAIFLYCSAFALGLSLGTHLSDVVMVAPFLVAVLVSTRSARVFARSLGLLAVGASQYIYVIIRVLERAGRVGPSGVPGVVPVAPAGNGSLSDAILFIAGGPWRDAHARSLAAAWGKLAELGRFVRAEYAAAILVLALAGVALAVAMAVDRTTRSRGNLASASQGRAVPVHWGMPEWLVLVGVALCQVVFYVLYGPSQIGMVLPLVVILAIFASLCVVVIATLSKRVFSGRLGSAVSRALAIVSLGLAVVWAGSQTGPAPSSTEGPAELVTQMIDSLPPGSFVDGVDYRYRMIVNYFRLVEGREVKFSMGSASSDSMAARLVAEDKYFVLGVPMTLLRYQRADLRLEPYLVQDGAASVYRLVASGASEGSGRSVPDLQATRRRLEPRVTHQPRKR